MLKIILVALLPLLTFFSDGSDNTTTKNKKNAPEGNTGTLEKMIVSNGSVAMDLDLSRINGTRARRGGSTTLRFDVERNAFFTVLVFNDELRGPLPSSMAIIPRNSATLPAKLNASYRQLVIENLAWGEQSDLVVRDGKTGFIFFTVQGHEFEYDSNSKGLSVAGRLLISPEFAAELGRPSDAGTFAGQISINTTMRAIEVSQFVDGDVKSETMPGMASPEAGTVPGPDVVVGDLSGLAQFGAQAGTQVGLAVGTDSCNFGVQNLHWFANPENDHPVIPQNLYRMSGGATNDERFEQIGQSSVKHAFTALTNNICNLGCNGVGGTNLGSGCSDPYTASLNSGPNLGSRAWINPFTGVYPRNDSATTPNNSHTGHTHQGPSHRILTEISDLIPAQNAGATYYAEGQYITPHEYAWCAAHPGECNMYNNVSYRRYNVNNSASPFTFSSVGTTQRQKPAIAAWTGATLVEIKPDPANDGVATLGYKVTQTSPGVWHYEYAIYNQILDRGISSFSVPAGAGVTANNIGFHAPPQHPGWALDGTNASSGFASTPWTGTLAGGSVTWGSESLAQNPNANAIRWGTLYNFRFDSNRPPQLVGATVGFFKTGAPMVIQVMGPTPAVAASVSISGRVLSPEGQPLRNAVVTLDDQAGHTWTTVTGSLGFYGFDNVATGPTYMLNPSAKRYRFTPVSITPTDNVVNFDLTANPQGSR
jgi:hypothetical protein